MPRSPPPPISAAPPRHTSSSATSSVIVTIVISSAIIISASLYLLLRRCRRRSPRTFSVVDDVIVTTANRSAVDTSPTDLIASLPSFTFSSVGGTLTGADCAVCLSKFERSDLLRLLPLCCHAFHARCVDTWLSSNLTCPLCRSTVLPTENNVLNKILSQTPHDGSSSSFRIEIGSLSRRHAAAAAAADSGGRISYSVGEFDYIIDNYEVPIESINHRRRISDENKEVSYAPSAPEMPPSEELAAAAGGGGRSWLRDYVDRLASVSSRSSGRFFTGSSRRSEAAAAAEVVDLEACRVGEEISEFFRWLSGV